VRGPRAEAQPVRKKPRLVRNRLNGFLGRSAAVNRPSTHQHPREGARIALFETRGAGVTQRIVDRWSPSTLGFSPFALSKPTPLAQQDRTLWDRQQIAEGVEILSATLPRGAVGPYQLQATIAAVHDEAARADDTDWPQILALDNLLGRMSENPVVRLNHAITAAMVYGVAVGLELLDALDADTRLADHHCLDAVRAHLLELANQREAAVRHYRAAAGKTGNLPERQYLLTQAARLAGEPRP
jgi:hypothetical protein